MAPPSSRLLVHDGFSLDGKDDYIRVADSDSLDVLAGFTFDAWVYWEGFTDPDLVSVIAAKEGSFELGVRNFGGAQVYLDLDQVGAKETFLTSEESYLPVRRWVFLSVTFDAVSGELTLSFDGTPVGSIILFDRGAIAPTDSDLTIGAKNDDAHFKGRLDEVELYSRGLSRAEIEKLIETRESGKCSGSIQVDVEVVPALWSRPWTSSSTAR